MEDSNQYLWKKEALTLAEKKDMAFGVIGGVGLDVASNSLYDVDDGHGDKVNSKSNLPYFVTGA
ncbi:hypothetical protein LguiB_000994 [Lonicera macranthoides]